MSRFTLGSHQHRWPTSMIQGPEEVHTKDWKRLYSDGTVTNWRQQSTDFFTANAGIKDSTPATKYFDSSLYLKTIV
jgi:hypothetical protein